MDDSELLEQFVRTRSQQVFAAIVERHIDLVYSAARRQLRDAASAEDATQAVFALLAQKAHKVRHAALTAWLFTTTRYVCANARRREARRTLHERKAAEMKAETHQPDEPAWKEISPLLDEAIDSLPDGDKSVVLARYFEKRSFKEVGEQFAISEEAARKRVDRATDKLKAFFARAGVVALPAGGLEAALLASAVTAAPQALAGAIAAKSIASAGAVGIGKWGAFLAATTGKKVAAVAVGAVALVGGTAAVVAPIVNNDPAPPLAKAAPASAPATIISATTSSGVVVELLGISNLKDDKWWDAAGNPLPKAPFTGHDWMREQPETRLRNGEESERYEFAIRALYKDDAPSKQQLFVQPVFGVQTNQQMWETPTASDNGISGREAGLARIVVGWKAPSPQQVKMTIGVAAGEWQMIAESTTPTVETEHVVRPDKPNLKMIVSPVSLEDKSDNPRWVASTQPGGAPYEAKQYTQVALTYSPTLWSYTVDQPETRLVAVVDGKEIGSEHRRSETPAGSRDRSEIHAFPVAPEKITAIRFQARKYEPVVFENLSLKSEGKTEPVVSVKPIGTPMAAPPPPRSARKPRPT